MNGHRRRLARWAVPLLCTTIGACCSPESTLEPGVTLSGVRTITLGMTPQKVGELLGPPFGTVVHPNGAADFWYGEGEGGFCRCLQLHVTFTAGAVTEVSALIRGRNADEERPLYRLSGDGPWEAPDLNQVFPLKPRPAQGDR